ncbi:amidohydrolase family protein [Pseudoalteromonas sp. T1lg65]|uniref:amidohydrolase family protein n=1 Tax=Pseudoalteromonas sp. T1lg65 TaxID=2077101 RepID=UPI003F792809
MKTILMLLSYALFSQMAFAEPILLINGTLLDPSDRSVTQHHLMLDEQQIIGRFHEIPDNYSGKIIDITGKFVIPGMIDMHTHAFGNRAPNTQTEVMGPSTTAQVVLHAGVTGYVDLFGNENQLIAHRELQRRGVIEGADIYASLTCLTAPGGHCSQFGKTRTIANEAEAKKHILELAKHQADVIKLVSTINGHLPSLSPELLKFSVTFAKQQGLKSIVHIHTLADIENAISAGADAITHLPDDAAIPDDLAKTIAANNIAMIPTLACDTDEYEFMFSAALESPLVQKLTAPRVVQGYASAAAKMTESQKQQAKQRTQKYYQSISSLIKANVTLLAGSDAGNYGTLQGFTVHREIEKFAAAGLSNWQALASATSHARAFLGEPVGLKEGAQPSVVILNQSPIESVRHTQSIWAVIHRGQLVN